MLKPWIARGRSGSAGVPGWDGMDGVYRARVIGKVKVPQLSYGQHTCMASSEWRAGWATLGAPILTDFPFQVDMRHHTGIDRETCRW